MPFGSSESEVISIFRTPIRQNLNRELENELHFPDHIFRFENKSAEFREISLLPKCKGSINGKLISWDDSFLDWLRTQDSDLKEALGFVISLKLGIALSGFHDHDEYQLAIHAFRSGDWDMFASRMRPSSARGSSAS